MKGRIRNFSTSAEFVRTPLIAEGLALRAALQKCRDLKIERVRWISREKNKDADLLAKLCLADEQVLYALNVT
ncbi:unnamed protein product [Brassica rapa]|uniref:RNase H type-1 domain-containing protein n=2 Tax=Brassica TaxID=3705 RepID=A0A8D9GRM3_BRACM|nr:unnamed protein product [Brassica napus]CAG7885590.1 unnamed protein product [Brassica rapa]